MPFPQMRQCSSSLSMNIGLCTGEVSRSVSQLPLPSPCPIEVIWEIFILRTKHGHLILSSEKWGSPIALHLHPSAPWVSSCSSILPLKCSYQFMAPEAPVPGKLTWLCLSGWTCLSIFQESNLPWNLVFC